MLKVGTCAAAGDNARGRSRVRGLGEMRADPQQPDPTERRTGDGREEGGAARGSGDRPTPEITAGRDRDYRDYPARRHSRRRPSGAG